MNNPVVKRKTEYIPPVWMMTTINKFRYFLISLSQKLSPPGIVLFDRVSDIWLTKAIGIAAKLNIADYIKQSPKTIEELAELTATNPDALSRMMRALSGHGIFKLKKDKYHLTWLSKGLLEGPGSMKYMIIAHLGHQLWPLYDEMFYSIKTGKSVAEKKYGTSIFEHIKKQPEENEIFTKAMSNTSEMLSSAIVSVYNFSVFRNIIDIGGGEGFLLSALLYKNKSAKGIVLDEAHVVESAQSVFESYGVSERATIIAGNFFNDIPSEGDLYILKNIIHNWDDEKALQILNNIRKSISTGVTLLIIESVIDKKNNPSMGKLTDLLMLMSLDGAKERTAKEYNTLLQKSGFRLNKIYSTVAPFSIIESIAV